MNVRTQLSSTLIMALLATATTGCDDKAKGPASKAPIASASAPATPTAPKAPVADAPDDKTPPSDSKTASDSSKVATASAKADDSKTSQTKKQPKMSFNVVTKSSAIDFLMGAPLENIHGVANKSVHGALTMNLNDLTSLRGSVRINLDTLVLYQAKVDKSTGKFGNESKSDKQNEHMKTWFQMSSDAPAAMREKNRWATFTVKSVSKVSNVDVTKMTGNKRKVQLTVAGDFELHGLRTSQTAKMEAEFAYAGDNVTAVKFKSLRPIRVSLAKHKIEPRSAFDKLAQKTLAAMGQKVAENAPISIRFTLQPLAPARK